MFVVFSLLAEYGFLFTLATNFAHNKRSSYSALILDCQILLNGDDTYLLGLFHTFKHCLSILAVCNWSSPTVLLSIFAT